MKKRIILSLTMLLAIILMNPLETSAKEKKTLECNYDFNGENLQFIIEKDNLKIPFEKDENWYTSENFKENYIKSSNNGKVCPTITVEDNGLFKVVFTNARDNEENGVIQTKINAKENGVIDTKIGTVIGIYNSKEYFIPTFRLLSDGTIEWSIDNSNFYEINEQIKYKEANIITIDEKLVKKAFTNNENKVKIYRCVKKANGKTIYNLKEDNKYCESSISNKDGQGEGSKYYNTRIGDPNCDSSILGDPDNDPESVAWLVKHLLNYLKVIGPMIVIVLGGVDFTKAIIMGDDETLQKSYQKLLKRLVLIIVLFFIPDLVMFLLNLFGITGTSVCGLN